MTAANPTKRIVCLANSRKRNGRCVAGKELLEDGRMGGWVRPVSAREDEEVSPYERQYEDGAEPRILDVIDVPVLSPRPKGYQRENWLLDPGRRWVQVDRVGKSSLSQFTDTHQALWLNGHSTRNGTNDRIPLSFASSLDSSLRLIWIDRLELSVSAPGADHGDFTRRMQGLFKYNGTTYRLRVTDPIYEQRYPRHGTYGLGGCFIAVSLGEPYEGYAYKLVAAIIEQ